MSNHQDIFALDAADSPPPPALVQIDLAADDPNHLYTTLDYETARRIEHARMVLADHSQLVFCAQQANESVSLTRAKLFARLSPAWSPQRERDLFHLRPHQRTLDPLRVSITVVAPSNSPLEADEEPRPSSYTSLSFGSFKSPDRRFRDRPE